MTILSLRAYDKIQLNLPKLFSLMKTSHMEIDKLCDDSGNEGAGKILKNCGERNPRRQSKESGQIWQNSWVRSHHYGILLPFHEKQMGLTRCD